MIRLRNKIYYSVRPLIPRRAQLFLRRIHIQWVKAWNYGKWPIDYNAATMPERWRGWPEGKRFALILTHDVDTSRGYQKVRDLAELEMRLGFRSSFNFVAKRYEIDTSDLKYLSRNGFEIGVHGVYHDGKKFQSYDIFMKRAQIINRCLAEWGAVGFRAPAMQHNLEWISELNLEYDASTFDSDPFEPQSDGVGTIFPFWVEGNGRRPGFVELPYTLPQDFTLFILMKHKTNHLWKEKLDWLVQNGGMVLLNTHPDNMCFEGNQPGLEEYSAELYSQLLEYIQDRYPGEYWHCLPKQVARFFKDSRDNNEIR